MGGKKGDGVVTKEEVYLDYAENYYIEGKCEGSFNYLHTDIINVEKYPEVYEIINKTLKD